MSNPYDSLPPRAFWKRSVGDVGSLDIGDLYKRKFPISADEEVGSAGSCFAQHIGRKLRENNFAYLDAEPAPGLLPAEDHLRFGYGMYSARFGNIYTARQLLQLFDRAFGDFVPSDDVWWKEGRCHDAFRPTIEPDGFESRDEMLALRVSHLACVRDIVARAGVFVFTFGLTETWMSRHDGAVYPVCPGVAAGEFSDTDYAFANFGFREILSDMETLFDKWHAINPAARFLLTVSPVPLTATASGDHVLVATTYSKSVLRAVAGELVKAHEFVDYFPSYELIASPPFRAMFFAPNMRSVAPQGVSHAMSHFFAEHPPPAVTARPRAEKESGPTDDDVACDEELLDLRATA